MPRRWLGDWLSQSIMEAVGQATSGIGLRLFPSLAVRNRSRMIRWALRKMAAEIVRGVDRDDVLMRRIAGEMDRTGVTHVLPMLSILAPFILKARKYCSHPVRVLVTFQGYEIYTNPAREIGLEQSLFKKLREAVEESDFPAVAVSEPYANKIEREIGIPRSRLTVIPPGILPADRIPHHQALDVLSHKIGLRDFHLPIVTIFGRQDSEKGIDLLLYAAKILERRREQLQLIVAGPNAFGETYRTACQQIAEHLRLSAIWCDYLTDETRAALIQASRCVVCPSIHGEPFGMVPVEAMSLGTPCIVPDTGGIADLPIYGNLQGGLRFKTWDSGDLADVISSILRDNSLHTRLSRDGPSIAAHYSVSAMTDRVLDHIGI